MWLCLAACTADPLPARSQFGDQKPDVVLDAQLSAGGDSGDGEIEAVADQTDLLVEEVEAGVATVDAEAEAEAEAETGTGTGTDADADADAETDAETDADADAKTDADADAGTDANGQAVLDAADIAPDADADLPDEDAVPAVFACAPCETAAACGPAGVCLANKGLPSFCGTPCGAGCLPGFACLAGKTTSGAAVLACQPLPAAGQSQGACPCPVGGPDFCNGQDDDCDGVTDEGACDDANVCTDDACDAKAGGCSHVSVAAACSDDNACTVGEACKSGACASGNAAVCDDGNPCTANACDPKSGCTVAPVAGIVACSDGNACTSGDACKSGACAPAGLAVCDDGKPCTADACDAKSGCTVAPVAGIVACSDGNACTTGDECKAGLCAAGKATVCDDGKPCTTDACNAASGCTVAALPSGTVCSDGNACTNGDACQNAACMPGPALPCLADSNPCTTDSCDAKLGCQHPAAANGTLCGGVGACTAGLCSPGVDPSNPANSCKAVQAGWPGAKDGQYWLDPDGPVGVLAPALAACAFGLDGGGWTLVAVVSNDGQNTWTWNAKLLWSTNTATFGNLGALTKDFKSPLMHALVMKDLLFVHAPSGAWAGYHGVGDGSQSLAKKIEAIGGQICWQPGQGWPLSAGTIAVAGTLCSTHLYFNANDHDGKPTCGDDDQSWGPAWSAKVFDGCPFDDPGSSSGLGADFFTPTIEQGNIGFGGPLALNSGVVGTGANRMAIYVR